MVAREVGVGAETLERWREDAQSSPARGRAGTAGARLDALITRAAVNDAGKSAWWRQLGVYPADLDKGRAGGTTALAHPEDLRASPHATRDDRKRIKKRERELLRKNRALAETAPHGTGRAHRHQGHQARASWRQRLHARGHGGAGDVAVAGRQALVLAASHQRRQRLCRVAVSHRKIVS